MRRCLRGPIQSGIVAVLACVTSGVTADQEGAFIFIFRSPSCGHCASVERPSLDKLGDTLGVRIETKIYNIDDIENYKLLLRVEKELGDSDNEFPIVIVGRKMLAGNEEVEKGLEAALVEWIAAGRPVGPEVLSAAGAGGAGEGVGGTVAGKPVYGAIFSQGGCATCDRIIRALDYLTSRYPSFDYRHFDTREADAARLFEAACEESGVPEADRRRNPAVFVGKRFLLEKAVTPTSVETLVAGSLSEGTHKPWEVSEEALSAAEGRIVKRFASLGAWTVLAAGLVDGINPCAFATIVFFISYLLAGKRARAEVVAVGLVFSAAVFATYLAVGAGALGAIVRLRAYAWVSKCVDFGAGGLAVVFGMVSVSDYFKARTGAVEEMALVLPRFLKRRINLNISRQIRLRGIVVGAAAAGALVSLFELACTGQVYLPTLALISGDAALKARAVAYLVAYNLLFVAPLLLIVGLVGLGMGSARLTGFFQRHVAAGKLALAALFLVMGAAVLATAVGR